MKTLFNWFDIIAVGLILAGLFVGRRRGMSSELLDLLLWAGVVFGGVWLAPPVGGFLVDLMGLSVVPAYMAAYLMVAVAIFLTGLLIRRGAGDKLVSADFFGGFEYYLGMVAGVVRFLCILLFAMALLHVPRVSDQQLQTQLASQNENLGSIYFPPFGSIQRAIFKGSVTGQLVEEHLPFVLLQADPSRASGGEREGIGRRREREVDDVMNMRR